MRSFTPKVAVTLLLLIPSGTWPVSGQAEPHVVLAGKQWSVEINPSTLSAIGRFANALPYPVSHGIEGLGAAANLKVEAARASWDLPAAKMRVMVRMEDDRLFVEFVSTEAMKLTWPVVAPDDRSRGILLPLGEGFYIPLRERLWQDFALHQSPISTMESLSMPLWGIDYGDRSLTYILLNPFDNELAFERQGTGLEWRLTHTFQNNYPEMRHGMMVVPGPASPIEPARIFRKWLMETRRFVPFSEKVRKLPELEKLFGAAHVYIWAGGILDVDDVRQWPALVLALQQPGNDRARRVVSMLPSSARAALREGKSGQPVSRYLRTEILAGLNEAIRNRDLYEQRLWPLDSLPAPARELAKRGAARLTYPELAKVNGCLISLTYPQMLADCADFGGGVSPKMIARLKDAGLDRLWLGVSDVDVLHLLPETVSAARSAGYLFGPYDSYHSIHPPDAKETWPTAQFDRELFEKGAIVKSDGRRDQGFQGVGSHLSSIAAEPYVRRRVGAWMQEFGFNSYFVDCDATGELFDNYSPMYPATKELDMTKRLERMAWIRDTYRLVVGSEVGAWFAAADIHFGHGMMTPVFGYRDPLLRDPKSPYFMGQWYPAGRPTRFFTHTELPKKYKDIYFDPRYRLPLFQAAFHDSIITTHHWEYPSWKFTNVQGVNELLELLYAVPPLYHLDLEKLLKQKAELQRHHAFFSPNYRKLATVPLTEFSWLTADRLVQRTVFGDEASVVVNFSARQHVYEGQTVPPAAVLLVWKKTGQAITYQSKRTDADLKP